MAVETRHSVLDKRLVSQVIMLWTFASRKLTQVGLTRQAPGRIPSACPEWQWMTVRYPNQPVQQVYPKGIGMRSRQRFDGWRDP